MKQIYFWPFIAIHLNKLRENNLIEIKTYKNDVKRDSIVVKIKLR